MKKLLAIAILLLCTSAVFGQEKNDDKEYTSTQDMKFDKNIVSVIVQKQPLAYEHSQNSVIKHNWFCVIVQVNGKIRVNPMTNTYEVE